MENNNDANQFSNPNGDKESIYSWLKTDVKVQEYLSRYSKRSADRFMLTYASLKPIFVKDGDVSAVIAEKRDEAGIVAAQQLLLQIQQKKLFDLFCLWNAEQIKHDDFKCSWDFIYWESHIAECSVLTPIAPEEFELYMQYAASENFDYKEPVSITSLFWCMKPIEDETIDIAEFPAWFQYYYLNTNDTAFLFLDNIRLGKERFYFDIYQKHQRDEIERQYASGEVARPVKDTRPMIEALNYKHIKSFIQACENKEMLGKFENYYNNNINFLATDDKEDGENAWLEEKAQDAIYELQNLKELVPVDANADWRKAIIAAHENYLKKQIIEALPIVYEDYCMRISNNLGLNWQEPGNSQESLATQMKANTLKGRVINGEPEDFNF